MYQDYMYSRYRVPGSVSHTAPHHNHNTPLFLSFFFVYLDVSVYKRWRVPLLRLIFCSTDHHHSLPCWTIPWLSVAPT